MLRRQSCTARAGAPRSVSVALALMGVFLQLSATIGGAVHLALVRHERCPEHGELIHGHGASHSSGGATLVERTAPTDDRARALAADPDGADGSHDACSIVGLARQRYVVPAAAPSITPGVVATAPSVRVPQLLMSPRGAAYRLAPKTSPPVQAAA